MKKFSFVLSSVFFAFIASVGIHATTVPFNMYVEPGSHSCLVTWEDNDNSAWNLRYRLYSEEPEVELIGSVAGTDFTSTSTYYDITLPAPWGGNNLRGANSRAIYFRQKGYQNATQVGQITYTIPDGYENMTFTMKITTDNTSDGTGNLTVATPQTAAVGHNFSAGETYSWVVTASAGEKITVTSTKSSYSPDMALLEVYTGDATSMKTRAYEWTYVNNLDKMEYNIEGLEAETDYEVQVQAIGTGGTLSDWTRADVFTTLAEGEEPIIPSVHILGEVDDQIWASDAGTKMEYDPETETYTATVHAEAGATFGFTTEIDANDELGGWDYVNLYRFGPAIEGEGPLDLTDDLLGQQLSTSSEWDHFTDVHVLKTGDYEITVSLEQRYIIIGRIAEPEHGYVPGDVDHNGVVGMDDLTRLINYLVYMDESYVCMICADVNSNGTVNMDDLTALINLLVFQHI